MRLPRFYPIVDTESAARHGCGATLLAEALLEGGARILQWRHKGQFTREILAETLAIGRMCRQAGAIFVVDDRADIARLAGAGVHVGQDDLSPADARRIVGEALVGFSTHNREQWIAAGQEPADYLALGPIYATASKRNPDPVLGVDQVRALRPLSGRPLVVIGGITQDNARAALEAGADSVAVIADLFAEACDKRALRERAEEWVDLTAG